MFAGVYMIMVFDPQILFNHGFYDLMEVRIPAGTLLKPLKPAALSCRTHALGRIFDILGGLLGQGQSAIHVRRGIFRFSAFHVLRPRQERRLIEALQAVYADGSWGKYHGGNVERLEEAFGPLSPCRLRPGLCQRHLRRRTGGTVPSRSALATRSFRPATTTGATSSPFTLWVAGPVLVDVCKDNWKFDPARTRRGHRSEHAGSTGVPSARRRGADGQRHGNSRPAWSGGR